MIELEDWLPMPPQMGPPLPKSMEIYWPWYKPPEVPPEVYTCPYCGAQFATEAELNYHIQTVHPPPEVPPEVPKREFANLEVTGYDTPVAVGSTCRVKVRFGYRGPRTTATLYSAIGNAGVVGFDEIIYGSKTISVPETLSWEPYEGEISIYISSAIRAGVYDIYAKIDGVISPFYENVITIEAVPPEVPKYVCPYSDASFTTATEFNAHILAQHPTPVEEIYFSVHATFPPKKREYWGEAAWQYIDWMYVYTCSPVDGGGFFSPSLKQPWGLSTPAGAEVGVQLPVYYSAGPLNDGAPIEGHQLKEEFAIPFEYEPGYYIYNCPEYIAGELRVRIYRIGLDEGGGLTNKTFITEVTIPIIIYPDARIEIDLTPYCPSLD